MPIIRCPGFDCGRLFDAPHDAAYHSPECRSRTHAHYRPQETSAVRPQDSPAPAPVRKPATMSLSRLKARKAEVSAIVTQQRARARAEKRPLAIQERAWEDSLRQVTDLIAHQKNEARRQSSPTRQSPTRQSSPAATTSLSEAWADFVREADPTLLQGTDDFARWGRSQLRAV